MSRQISDALFSQLGELIATRMGLSFPTDRRRDLERGIEAAAREFGHKDMETCARWLLSAPLTQSQIETLAGYLTVGETYFFRERKAFAALEHSILPELIRRRAGVKNLRIWCAGCASGEEPYSIAMLLHRLLPDRRDWNVTILATDINYRLLKKALGGSYNRWSFRDCPEWIQAAYFKKGEGGSFELRDDIRKMVTFAYHNLAEDPYPSLLNNTTAIDIIFCRNVLMYFPPERQAAVIQNFYNCLTERGWLIVSPSEASSVLYPQFVAANFADGAAPLYRKGGLSPATAGAVGTAGAPFSATAASVLGSSYGHCLAAMPARAAVARGKVAVCAAPERNGHEETQALYEQGHYTEAENTARGLLSHNQADYRALDLLARIYADQGRLSEALDCCRKLVATEKLNPSHHYLLATVLQEQGGIDEAASSLKHTLFLDPDFVLAHVALGNITLRQGRLRESRKHFANALALLSARSPEAILSQADGMTVGRLRQVIESTTGMEQSP